MVIGVSGKMGAGKDYVCQILKSYGFSLIDVDKLGHETLIKKQETLRSCFGDQIIFEGKICRKKLGEIVFKDPQKLTLLEEILHPEMKKRVELLIKEGEGKSVINAALLYPMGLSELCDAIFWVKAPFFCRLRRVLKRDRQKLSYILLKMSRQTNLSPQLSNSPSDIYYINNSCFKRECIEKRVKRVFDILRSQYE